MTLTLTNGMIAGQYNAWIAYRNLNGYPMGNCGTPDSPTHNSVYPAYKLKYQISVGLPNTTRQRAIRRGGQRVRGSRSLGISDLGAFPIVIDGKDEFFEGYVRAYTPDNAYNSEMVITAGNAGLLVLPRFILGMSIGLTDTDNAVDYYLTYIWNNVTFEKPLGEASSQQDGENPNPLEWTVTPDLSSRMGFGALYSASGLNVVEDNDAYVAVRNREQLYSVTYSANGIATTFNLPYRAKSSDATGAAGNILLKNGVITPVTSIATDATKLVTLAAAGADFDIWNLLYPTAYKAA